MFSAITPVDALIPGCASTAAGDAFAEQPLRIADPARINKALKTTALIGVFKSYLPLKYGFRIPFHCTMLVVRADSHLREIRLNSKPKQTADVLHLTIR